MLLGTISVRSRRQKQEAGENRTVTNFITTYFSSDVRVLKPRKIRWAVQVARVAGKRNTCRAWVRHKGKCYSVDLGMNG